MATLHPSPELPDRIDDVDPDPDGRLSWSPGEAHWSAIAIFVALHAAFGLVSDLSPPPMASLHAIAVLVIAVWLVGVRRNVEAVACIAAYIASSDVLWRMTGAAVPWEISKLALIVIFAVATIRVVRRPRRIGLPLLVLLLLVPSAVVTIERFGFLGGGRERLSFELAAHVALVAGLIFFSNVRAERQKVAGVLWMIVGPCLAVNTIATAGTVGLQSGDFSGTLSNTAASGGFGPNQVSALIGVAAMACVLLVFLDRRPVLRVLAGGLAVWFLAQSALTFSRGGSFNLVVALVVAAPFFLRTAQTAMRFLSVSALLAVVIGFVMVPVIQQITNDEFGQRFTSGDPTLRTDLMRIELEAWGDNVGFGIGVGMMERTVEDRGAANRGELPQLPAHTEYTRLVAEHGLLGVGVILTLLGLAIRAIRSQPLLQGRIFSAVLLAWCASEVSHSATRLALVPFLFALASLTLLPDRALQAAGDASGPAEGEDPVEGDGPPPGPGAGLPEHRAGDLPAGGEPRSSLDGVVGETVEAPPGDRA